MSHRKVLSHGNVPFSWEEKPGVSKFCFRDFQALALHSSSPPPSYTHSHGPDSQLFDVGSKTKIIPPPPCRLQPRSIRNNASAKGSRWEEDPFLVAYKECTKSVKNGKFMHRGSKGAVAVAVVKKSNKLFGFSCNSVDSCEIRDDGFFKLRRDRIRVSTWK